jgi:hypothetical protein
MNHQHLFRTFFLITLWLAGALAALAQTAQVTGRISDQTGSVVPDAKVTVTNVDNGFKRETVTNSEGFFTVPLLQPGTYQVAVQKSGFKPLVQSGVVLQVEQVARLDYTLETGAVTETVNIAAAVTAALETETSSLGKVVDQQRIQNLPLLGRNPYSLVALVPGARPSAGLNDLPVDQISQSFVSINGARGPESAGGVCESRCGAGIQSGNQQLQRAVWTRRRRCFQYRHAFRHE